MPYVDLCFPVLGNLLNTDHGYSLYGAISRVLGQGTHDHNGLGFAAIGGTRAGNGKLGLTPHSCLRIRTPLEALPGLLKLSGRQLDVDGHSIRLGAPRTLALEPAASLLARIVTVKGFTEPAEFLSAAQRQLDELGVKGKPSIPLRRGGPHEGKPARRVLRIKDKQVVGFSLLVQELTAEESILLQEKGIGGRRHMGCGLFLPCRNPDVTHAV